MATVADHFDSDEVKNRLSGGNSASKDGSWRKSKVAGDEAAGPSEAASKITQGAADKAELKESSLEATSTASEPAQSESKQGNISSADAAVAAAPDRRGAVRSAKQEKDKIVYGYTPTEVKVDVAALQPREADDGFFVLSVDVPGSIIGLVLGIKFPPFNLIDTIARATFTLIEPPPGTTPTSKPRGGDSIAENVPFSVKGKSSKNVALSASFLMRIAGGERTKDVLNDAQACSPDPSDQLVPDKAVSRTSSNRKRSDKERGVKREAPAVEGNAPAAESAPAGEISGSENRAATGSSGPKRSSESGGGRASGGRSGRGRGPSEGRGRGRGRESKRSA